MAQSQLKGKWMEGLVEVLVVEQGHQSWGACWATRCGGSVAVWESGSLGVLSQHKLAIQLHFLSSTTALPPLSELVFWFHMIPLLAELHSIFASSYSIYILYLWYIGDTQSHHTQW